MTSSSPAAGRRRHLHHLAAALAEARKSPPKPTNFRVGCVIVSADGAVLSTGYTLELPGNTHAEQPDGGVRKVVFGAKEPGTFVRDSQSCRRLTEAGVEWEYVAGMDSEILAVATEGHEQKTSSKPEEDAESTSSSKPEEHSAEADTETDVDAISPAERRRQEALPRNPMKRMMELPRRGPS
ncbi:hypothetical protein DV737_g2069, partial [Chaetothyriales sp. CBS 132003]